MIESATKRTLGKLSILGLLGAVLPAACLSRPVEPLEPRPTSTVTELQSLASVDKIDLLLAIDDSGSMGDKQDILAQAVPNLVERLANPKCVDDVTGMPIGEQPTSPTAECAPGSEREFPPVLDIHIGIITSSLGGYGSVSCTGDDGNRRAHLQTTGPSSGSGPDLVGGAEVPTYQGFGFLAWDPGQTLDPPGIGDAETLSSSLEDLVRGVGQSGCGYEAQLESVYRFLVDDAPPLDFVMEGSKIVESGVDETIARQRADFLRQDSLLAIIMLTDENDCSLGSSTHTSALLAETRYLPRPECAADPNDPCCLPCSVDPDAANCPYQEACYGADGKALKVPSQQDDVNLKCFDAKRRFGLDALTPTSRYVDALTKLTIENRNGEMVRNPLFPESKDGGAVRSPSLVYFAGIVGVPWQDVARDPLDLAAGGFKTTGELKEVDPATGMTGWDLIVGNAAEGVPAGDPLMRESIAARSGTHPITGEDVAPPTAGLMQNSINGHERDIKALDDLQYACIFELPAGADASQNADCKAEQDPVGQMNPLCQDASGYHEQQFFAKAYPGLRQLEVLRGMDEQGIVASVCPAYVGDDSTRDDYGYRPAVGAIIERLKIALNGQCLNRELVPDASGQVTCTVLEARTTDTCECAAPRQPVTQEHTGSVDAVLETDVGQEAGWNCFCELPQLSGAELEACQNDTSHNPVVDGELVSGWCYIDAAAYPQIGNPTLVSSCAPNPPRQVRLVGDARIKPGSTAVVTCAGDSN